MAHQDGPNRRLHEMARVLAHRTVGAAGYSTMEETLAGYRSLIDRLARSEQMRVVIMGATHPGGELRERAPGAETAIDQFNLALASKTRSRHFEWLDRQALRVAHGDADVMQRDGLHKTAAFHRHIADALLEVLAR